MLLFSRKDKKEAPAPPPPLPVRILDDETGEVMFGGRVEFPVDEIFAGNILTIQGEDAKRHYLINTVEGEPVHTARISPAKSSLRKGLLLLVILTATWFALRFAINFLFT